MKREKNKIFIAIKFSMKKINKEINKSYQIIVKRFPKINDEPFLIH